MLCKHEVTSYASPEIGIYCGLWVSPSPWWIVKQKKVIVDGLQLKEAFYPFPADFLLVFSVTHLLYLQGNYTEFQIVPAIRPFINFILQLSHPPSPPTIRVAKTPANTLQVVMGSPGILLSREFVRHTYSKFLTPSVYIFSWGEFEDAETPPGILLLSCRYPILFLEIPPVATGNLLILKFLVSLLGDSPSVLRLYCRYPGGIQDHPANSLFGSPDTRCGNPRKLDVGYLKTLWDPGSRMRGPRKPSVCPNGILEGKLLKFAWGG